MLKPDADTFEGFADMSIGGRGDGRREADKHRGVNFPISGGDVNDGPEGDDRPQAAASRSLATPPRAARCVKFTQFVVKIGKNKTKLFAKSGHAAVRFIDLDLSDATISGSTGTNLKIKDAEATPGQGRGRACCPTPSRSRSARGSRWGR